MSIKTESELRKIIIEIPKEELKNRFDDVVNKYHCTTKHFTSIQVVKDIIKDKNLEVQLDIELFCKNCFRRIYEKNDLIQQYEVIFMANRKVYFPKKFKGDLLLKSEIPALVEAKKEHLKNLGSARMKKYNSSAKVKERVKILKFIPPKPRVRKIKPVKVEKIKKLVVKKRKTKVEQKPIKIVELTKKIIEHREKSFAKHQMELAKIKAEFDYNKANGIKMVIEDEVITKQQIKINSLLLIENLTLDDFAESLENFIKEYIVVQYSSINQFLFRTFCKEKSVNNTMIFYKVFTKKIKQLLDESDFGKEVAEEIEENLITYGKLQTLIKRSDYENKQADRFKAGKNYYLQIKAAYIKSNGDWIV